MGRNFNAKVWKKCGKSISYSGPPNSGEFFLLASFSRYRFRLSEENVSSCLHALLGGDPALFQVSMLETSVFRFVVSCFDVGLLVVKFGPIVLDSLKLGFFLCNDRGFHEAYSFSKMIGLRFVLRIQNAVMLMLLKQRPPLSREPI